MITILLRLAGAAPPPRLRILLTVSLAALLVVWSWPSEHRASSGQIPGKPFAEDENPPTEPGKVLTCLLEGTIDEDIAESLQTRIKDFLDKQPGFKFIHFRLNSPGTVDGKIEPAKKFAEFIEIDLRGYTSIAHVDKDGKAGNGAALIALACNKLFMGRNSRIGFLTDSQSEVLDEREGDAQEARRLLSYYAAKRKRSYPPSLAEALVSRFHADVYEVTFERRVDENNQIYQELLTKDGLEALDQSKRASMKNQKPIAPRNQRLTLTAQDAFRYGVAEGVVEDRFDLFSKARIPAVDSDVYDLDRGRLKPASREWQAVIDFLNHPFIRFLLVLGGFLGLLLEFKLPGTFIPLASSTGCFLLFFLAGFFPATGPEGNILPFTTTSVFELVLFLCGMLFIATEFFLLPGVVIFGLLGMILVLASMVLAMVPPSGALDTAGMGPKDAFFLLIFAIGSGLGVFFLLLKLLPHSSFFNRSGIITHAALQGIPTADSVLEGQARDAALMGKVGVALTPLRPAGKIDIDGQILDVVAEGDFIEKGEKVSIIEVSGFRAVVQRHG